MATRISFSPLVDGVLTLGRIVQADGHRLVVDEYALEREVLAEVQAMLAAAGPNPSPLVRQRAAARIRAAGWLHLPNAA